MSNEKMPHFYCMIKVVKVVRVMPVVLVGLILFICPRLIAATNQKQCLELGSLSVYRIEFQGMNTTSSSVIERELENKIGSAFTCAKWDRERERLLDLDIFANVELEPTVNDSGISLAYTFKELPPYIPFIAVSKTDQDGLSIGPALASLNFLGKGIRAEFITRFGGTTEAQASLSSTRLGPLPLEYDVALLRINSFNHFGGFHENSWRTKLDLLQKMGGPLKILYAAELYYLQTRGMAKNEVLLTPEGDWVPRLGLGCQWDGRDRRHNPRQGLFQELRLTQIGGFLGGPADYREWLSDTRIYIPWISRNTLHLAGLYQYRTGRIGRTFGTYDRFHVGGVNTLRGFEQDKFQGKSEALVTFENRFDIIQKRTLKAWHWSAYYGLQGILGFEAASLWDHDAILERKFHSGYYTGLHLLVAGVDRIRLECGSNFAKLEWMADLGILDKADIQRFRAR